MTTTRTPRHFRRRELFESVMDMYPISSVVSRAPANPTRDWSDRALYTTSDESSQVGGFAAVPPRSLLATSPPGLRRKRFLSKTTVNWAPTDRRIAPDKNGHRRDRHCREPRHRLVGVAQVRRDFR